MLEQLYPAFVRAFSAVTICIVCRCPVVHIIAQLWSHQERSSPGEMGSVGSWAMATSRASAGHARCVCSPCPCSSRDPTHATPRSCQIIRSAVDAVYPTSWLDALASAVASAKDVGKAPSLGATEQQCPIAGGLLHAVPGQVLVPSGAGGDEGTPGSMPALQTCPDAEG